MTPLSNGIYLREQEIHEALTMTRNFERHAQAVKCQFMWLDDWPDAHGVYFVTHNAGYICIPRSSPFQELLTFAHEYHHARFGPRVLLYKQSKTQIARYEGRASAFGALAAMPRMDCADEPAVLRAFGPDFAYCAHYRIKHFEKYGW